MWDPLKRESADGPDTNGKAIQRNCVVATAANILIVLQENCKSQAGIKWADSKYF